MKRELLWAICKNIGRLFSGDFWWCSLTNPDFPTWLFIKMIVVSAVADLGLMILKPGYPSNED